MDTPSRQSGVAGAPLPMKIQTALLATLFCAVPLLAQERSARPARPAAARAVRDARPGPKTVGDYSSDIVVVRDAQEQALEQVRSLQERVEDPHTQASLESAVKEMERSLAILEEAKHSPEKLAAALAAEQSAYQALLKLAAREYQVSRSRNQQGGGQQGERAERQLDELELNQTDNPYETQRQASPQQTAEQREQLQVLNRLKELAQRQQDLNGRRKELQTALQEAKTEGEREEIRRRLKRLREEEQEMLADVDELRQRMERPENQSRMADARQQLDKTRSDVQRAAEALDDNSASQALSSGTRAQRQLQELTEDFRKKSSNRFADDMRQMRSDARELAQKQEELAKKLESLADPKRKTLSDSAERKELASQLTQQKGGLTNLFNEMRRVSEQSESAEPLLSKQLYDTLRQTDQSDPDKALDLSAELVNRGFLSQDGADSRETSGQQSGRAGGERELSSNQQPGSRGQPGPNGSQNAQSQNGNSEGNNSEQQQSASAQEQNGSSGSQGQAGNSGGQRANRDNTGQNGQRSAPSLASGSPNNRTGQGGGGGGNFRQNLFDGGVRTGG